MENKPMKTVLWGFLAVLVACATACSSTEEAAKQKNEARVRQDMAMRMWQERCKQAGEKIYKTADDVDGVFLLKIRSTKDLNYGDQFLLNDPYGNDVKGDGYISLFLRGGSVDRDKRAPSAGLKIQVRGYKFVEAEDPSDGNIYKYTGKTKVVGEKDRTAPGVQAELAKNPNYDTAIRAFVLDKNLVVHQQTRYGITYDDISTPEDREYWIAGSSLKVVDLQTKEVIAERIGYMVDWAQGSNAGNRSPWLFAADNACPPFAAKHGALSQLGQTYRFVEKVLRPAQQ